MNDETRAEAFARTQAEDRAVLAERRKRVLQHPDLAQRLTERPLEFARPENWNGYVPPKTTAIGFGVQVNDSPVRAALVAICAEALRRDNHNDHDDHGQPPTDTDWSTT